ncbi:MAG: rhomboid family intramembrane serine protease [Candidatus Micrarchaeota archaeon]
MRFLSALILSVLLLIPYFVFSQGTGFLPEEIVSKYSFNASSSFNNFFFHLFDHVGLQHLLGNLLVIVLFALILESVLSWLDVLLVFFSSGVLASLFFSFLNPATFLIGASAAAAGLMASALALRPKLSLVLLLLTPLLINFIVFPFVDYSINAQKHFLSSQETRFNQEVDVLVSQGRVSEANAVQQQVERVVEQKETVVVGVERQEETPTDFWVHVYGAVVGVGFLLLFKRKELRLGVKGFKEMGLSLRELVNK